LELGFFLSVKLSLVLECVCPHYCSNFFALQSLLAGLVYHPCNSNPKTCIFRQKKKKEKAIPLLFGSNDLHTLKMVFLKHIQCHGSIMHRYNILWYGLKSWFLTPKSIHACWEFATKQKEEK